MRRTEAIIPIASNSHSQHIEENKKIGKNAPDFLTPYYEKYRDSGCSEDSGLQTNQSTNQSTTPTSSNNNMLHTGENPSGVSETELRVTVELNNNYDFSPTTLHLRSISDFSSGNDDDDEEEGEERLRIMDDDEMSLIL